MKKTEKTMLTAAVFAAALGTSTANAMNVPEAAAMNYGGAKTAVSEAEMQQAVYGPAPGWDTPQPVTTTDLPNQAMYGPPSWFTTSPKESSVTTAVTTEQLMYGPPPWLTSEPEKSSVTTTVTTNILPETGVIETVPPAVYGPPSWFTTEPVQTTTDFPQQAMYGPPPYYYGDFDYDGKVTSFDLVSMRKAYVEKMNDPKYDDDYRYDVNHDGEFSIADLVIMQKYLLGQLPAMNGVTPPKNDTTTTVAPGIEDDIDEPLYGPPPSFN